MRPAHCYVVWFSQRTGSTLLCKALEETGLAGNPREWFNIPAAESLFDRFPRARDLEQLRDQFWDAGLGSNGVFGLKTSSYEPVNVFKPLVQSDANPEPTTVDTWNAIFPNCRHVFMARRNRLLQAVSWWMAIQSNVWHRQRSDMRSMGSNGALTDAPEQPIDLSEAYSFDAIRALLVELSMRETHIQEFLEQLEVTPYIVFYEDLVRDYESTALALLGHLGLAAPGVSIKPPYYVKLANDLSERWANRFKVDLLKTS